MTQNTIFPKALGRLNDIPRARLFEPPSPLQSMANLTRVMGGAQLFIKRDDCTELAFGGNKVRQLEFYFGDACARNADTVLITGAVQSNYVRQAAAAANKLGMDCHIQLEERVAKNSRPYRTSGNALLNRLLGATLYSYPKGEDEAGADNRLGEIAEDLQRKGRRPYIIPMAPGHAPLGALGYVVAAHEILGQVDEMGLALDEIVIATGSGNTHAGLLFGLRALGSSIPVTGICVRRDVHAQMPRMLSRCVEIAELLDVEQPVVASDVVLTDAFLAPGYGEASEATMKAILDGARTEGLMLDPTYMGKSMAGFMDRAKKSTADHSLMLVHTGGTPAIFAYQTELEAALESVANQAKLTVS